MEQQAFHPTVLVYFRQRLLGRAQAMRIFSAVLEALQQEGLIAKKTRQRLDSTHVLGLVARLSVLDCTRETLRLALEELSEKLAESERPTEWPLLWERYVENKLDYKSSEAVLDNKQAQAGRDIHTLLKWVDPLPVEVREGRQVTLLRKVFSETYLLNEKKEYEPVKAQVSGAVQNPHDAQAQYSAKGVGQAKKHGWAIKCRSPKVSEREKRRRNGRRQRRGKTSSLYRQSNISDAFVRIRRRVA